MMVLRRFHGDRRAATALEFALVSLPFLVLVFGTVEIAWQLAIGLALDSGTLAAARFGTTGASSAPNEPASVTSGDSSCAARAASIPWVISAATGGLLSQSQVIVQTSAYSNLSGMSGTAASGPGGAGQVVVYSISYTQPFLTGSAASLLGFGNASGLTHTSTIVVKNEPFGTTGC